MSAGPSPLANASSDGTSTWVHRSFLDGPKWYLSFALALRMSWWAVVASMSGPLKGGDLGGAVSTQVKGEDFALLRRQKLKALVRGPRCGERFARRYRGFARSALARGSQDRRLELRRRLRADRPRGEALGFASNERLSAW